ncbi:hypothetical protein FB45DRAFT_1026321 [Roridomyces roridus]|uniref:Uncharacterized protein n=1 Tax=Roridomyces roridus TaxID=1738132 RepID=A0AAD7BWY1_9AGAR|nr:hypothetical protein FB45DRAFT_1026321 [Roridomyces roridus]
MSSACHAGRALPPCPALPLLPTVYDFTYRIKRTSRQPGHRTPKPKTPMPKPQVEVTNVEEPRRVGWPLFVEKPKARKVVVEKPKLPEGYVFIPPPQPLSFPASYHLIPAGPQNAPKKPKRTVFASISNLAAKTRATKEKQ